MSDSAIVEPSSAEFNSLTGPYQHELLVHCYRILGSMDDAEDALQECMLRAWRRLDTLNDPGALRAWLYKIATNVALDLLDRRKARSLPPELSVAADPHRPLDAPLDEAVWLEPLPDGYLERNSFSPEARFDSRESVTLAFLTVLQQLPGRQRAVLVLRDVLDWNTQEAADCLEITLAAVTSALQRARVTLKKYQEQRAAIKSALAGDANTAALLARYVTAWEDADANRLVALLREDAILSMPPLPGWYQGSLAIRDFFALHVFKGLPRGSFRLAETRANACPALAVYQRADEGVYRPASLQVLTLDGGRIARVDCFLVSGERLFRRFSLPLTD